MFTPAHKFATPASLTALHLGTIPDIHLSAFDDVCKTLHNAMRAVGTAPHQRPTAKKYRGASLDALGALNDPKSSRRVLEEEDYFKHIRKAIDKGFPDADERGAVIGDDLRLAIEFALTRPQGPKDLTKWRRDQTTILNNCVTALNTFNVWILNTALRGKAARRVAPGPNIALIAAIATALDWPDQNIAADFCYGFPLLGTALPDSGLFRPLPQQDAAAFYESNIAPTLTTNVEYTRELVKELTRKGQALAPDDATAWALHETTRVEREEKKVLGPEFDLDQLWQHYPIWHDEQGREMSAARPSPRFATWQKDVVRAIDDYKRSLINWCWNPAETISPPSALFPIEILHEIASLCRRLELPLPAMQLAMDDVAFAYKRCAVLQQEYGILCYWNPEKKKVVFCEQWGLPFGAVASVTGFCRLPHMLTRFARPFFAVLSDHYIDDAMQPDFAAAGDSAQVALGHLFKKVGIPFSEKKRQRPAALQQELGVECDMRSFHTDGTASIQPTKERCKSILDTLLNCELSNKLTPALAKELFGKLSFCLQSLFGRVGRASALPLVQRCYNNKDLSFTHDLREMRRFFNIILDPQHLPKRTFRLGTDNRPPTFVWSDASEKPAYRGLGVVLHDEEEPVTGRLYAADVAPQWLVDIFLRHGETSICSLELLAALCALLTMHKRLRHRKICFFVDNTAAWSCMINGFSSSPPMAKIGNLFHLALAALEADCWVEWVKSEANIADLPSRPIHQRGPLYAARPVFKQERMLFPTQEELDNPHLLFNRIYNE